MPWEEQRPDEFSSELTIWREALTLKRFEFEFSAAMSKYAIGLDFGTESARAVLVDVFSGDTIASAVAPYPSGVIDTSLPASQVLLPHDWALQDPQDWLTAMTGAVTTVLADSEIDPLLVIGIGVDFTACTILPCLADGTPLCFLSSYRDNPHAWVKLWKHHAAQPQADRINQLATEREESWLPRYGGFISSEWLLPKALELLENAPELYAATDLFIEGGDWVVWMLSGQLTRNACAAGYKATWHKQDSFPSVSFLKALHPQFGDLYQEKFAGPITPPGIKVGTLTPAFAGRLGLPVNTAVASAIIDAHAASSGGGVAAPGTMFLVMGTSTCHMLLADKEVLVEGVSGVVEDGIVPGYFGYEAGQASVGDTLSWFVEHGTPAAYQQEAKERGLSVYALLSEKAARLKPGQSGLLALDWWNGCRTPLVDATLGGLVLGYSLRTSPEEIYRALVEATAFGTRLIVDLFTGAGVPVQSLRAGGGLTQTELIPQIYADIIGLPLELTASEQASAHGAALMGAVAGGAYGNLQDAIKAIAPPPRQIIQPIPAHRKPYDQLYQEYLRLVDLFGRSQESPLKRLHAIQAEWSSR